MSDYLWDKSGSDEDVEAFELSLSGLAYDRAAPELPSLPSLPSLPNQGGDYLWEKSGRDPQVEALEVSLAGLAYDGDPPVLPLRRVPTPSPPLRVVSRPGSRGAPWTHAKAMPLALAAGLMLMGFGVSYSALAKEKADVRRGWNLVPVLVASVDMSEGTVVSMEHLSQRSVPEQFVTLSVVKPDSASYVIGQKVQVAVAAGDPMLWNQFESTRAVERLASRLLKRARALAVEVKGTTSVGGWMRPNDHVDIIGSFKDPMTNEQIAVTIMQNVMVIATGKITGTTNVNLIPESERAYGHVSLMVLPEEAEMLVLAQELGGLTFTLRNEEDLDVLEERGRATISTLLSGERTKVLQMKRFNTIQVIRGASSPSKSTK
jgi:pilus assembly protein CpaB